MKVSETNVLLHDLQFIPDRAEPNLRTEERLIRLFLLIGFLAAIALEAWLLIQVWQLYG